jgi:EAL domain-containing protein (putative c-di-GMP-specific phosphodiesterase class I)
MADVIGAERVIRAIHTSLQQPVEIHGNRLPVGASIGITLFRQGAATDCHALLRQADVAMYTAKRTHRQYAFYHPNQDPYTSDRLALITDLQHAAECGQLEIYYQPIVDLMTKRVRQVEALLRWHHPDRGLLLPNHFIPLAEDTGAITALTAYVIERSLHQLRMWNRAGTDVGLTINLSARALQDARLGTTIKRLVRGEHLHFASVTLELTETAVMTDPERVQNMLAPLHRLGVKTAIDDYGTGYSSLALLKRLPIDVIKIDRTFVADMMSNGDDAAIVRSTINLGHDLGLEVVAEGVEDRATWDRLSRLGCDRVQGYYISRPLSVDDFGAWYATNDVAG